MLTPDHGLSRIYTEFDIDPSQTTSQIGGFLNCDKLGGINWLFGVISGNLINITTQINGKSETHLVSQKSLEKFLIRNKDLSGLKEPALSVEDLQKALTNFENNATKIKEAVTTLEKSTNDYNKFFQALKIAKIIPQDTDSEELKLESAEKPTVDHTKFENLIFRNKNVRSHLTADIMPIFAKALESEQKIVEPITIDISNERKEVVEDREKSETVSEQKEDTVLEETQQPTAVEIGKVDEKVVTKKQQEPEIVKPDKTLKNTESDLRGILQSEKCDVGLRELYNSNPTQFAGAVQIALKDGLPLDQKIRLRTFLTKEFPEHKRYMEYGVGLKDTNKKDYYERYMMPGGIETVLDHLKQKKNNPITLPCTVCHSFKTFADTMSKLERGEDIDLPQTFIIRCYKASLKMPKSDKDLSYHTTSVYVDRTKEGVIRVVSTDSTNGWYSLSLGLHQTVNEIQKKGKEIELFYFDIQRQFDEHNCFMFTLNDIIHFCQNQERLDHFLSKVKAEMRDDAQLPLRGDQMASIKVALVKMLPVGFIFLTQSMSKITDYVSQYEKEEKIGEKEQAQYEKSQKAHLDADVFIKKQGWIRKKQNLHAERRGDKFEGLLWKKIIQEHV